ncbi:MAG: DegQ family serine endoprotease [Gammaproteobacteria bacterium]|nr:DegQ family serine endoprotease [Gammaproteobacteria bacterium]
MFKLIKISALFFVYLGVANAALPALVEGEAMPSLAPMVNRVKPGVVNIATSSTQRTAQSNPLLNDPFFRYFFGVPQHQQQQQESRPQSLGTGVIVDAAKGLIITNHHVIKGADKIHVTLNDGREVEAELLGADADVDVALLKIKADKLTALEMADSDKLKVGDFVVAVGNPFGLNQTVTSGIVSALGRSDLGIEDYENFIQTDASINPGNSGGALVDLNGHLIGMNTAILAPGGGGGNVGIGFAIPINMVRQIVEQLIEFGEVRRGRLGISIQNLSSELAQAFGIPLNKGVVIADVDEGSPADKAGVEVGDVLIEVNHQKIRNASELRNIIGMIRVGVEVDLKVLRDRREKSLTATIKENHQQKTDGQRYSKRLAGALLGVIKDDSHTKKTYVFIHDVKRGSPAWYGRLRKDDLILSVNKRRVSNLEELSEAIANADSPLLLNIQRGREALFILLK